MISKFLLCLAHEAVYPSFRLEVMKDSGDQLAPALSHRYRYICMVKNKLRHLLRVLEAKY